MKWFALLLLLYITCPSAIAAAGEFTPGDIGFDGPAGSIPANWEFRYQQPGPGSGLTAEFSFEAAKSVMRVVGPAEKTVALQLPKCSFPPEGRVKLTIWARSAQGPSPFALFMLGDNYHWKVTGKFSAGAQWCAYSIEGDVPSRYEDNHEMWCRIDVPAGSDLLIGKVSLQKLPPSNAAADQTGNLLVNGDFLFGDWGWHRYYHAKLAAGQLANSLRQPEFEHDSLILPSGVAMCSYMLAYLPDEEYTLRARLRQVGNEPAKITLFLINGGWKIQKREFTLTPEYREESFNAKVPRSKFNRMYVRMEVSQGGAQIAQVQLLRGKNPPSLSPSLQLGVGGPTLFDQDTPGSIIIRAVRPSEATAPGTLKVQITDLSGSVVDSQTLPLAAGIDQSLKIPLPQPDKRGVFEVKLTASDGTAASFRYAVLRNLKERRFSSNPFAGHYEPYGEQNLAVFDRYFPVDGNINRFFSPADLAAVRDPIFQQELARSPYRNVMRVPYTEFFYPGASCEVTPQNEAALLEQVTETVRACRGKLYGIEIFNEPHLWRITSGPDAGKRTMDAGKVAYLLQKIAPAVKAIDPDIQIFGPVGGLGYDKYFEEFIAAGGSRAIDALDFHSYNTDPDAEDTAGQIRRLKAMFAGAAGKDIPAYNTEVYYGVRNTPVINSDDETERSYFRDDELQHAALMTSMLIHHAVNRVGVCNYMPRYLLSGVSGGRMYPLAAAAAVNAAIEFLGDAGAGQEVVLDDSLRCFLFENAKPGPLATLGGIGGNCGQFELPAGVMAYDLFGNELAGRTVKIGSEVVYLRFPATADAAKILHALSFTGFGDPVACRLSLSDADSLQLSLRNRRNAPQSVRIEMVSLPERWQVSPVEFTAELPANGETELRCHVGNIDWGKNQKSVVKIKITTAEGSVTREFQLTPLAVTYSPDLSFAEASVIRLGAQNLSSDFSPNLKWTGPDDLSAQFFAVWNEKGIKLRIIVTDDVFVPPSAGLTAWRNDSLQLFFDMRRDGTVDSDRRNLNLEDDLVYNIGWLERQRPAAYLAAANGNRYLGDANRTTGMDDAVRVECRQSGQNIIIYDIWLPSEALYLVPMRAGTRLGFSLLVNDDDNAGRKTGLTLSPPGTQPFRHAADFRDMILIK